MPPSHHIGLFHPRLVRTRVASLNRDLFAAHRRTVSVWLDHLRSGALEDTKETSLHAGFLERIFGDVLGYSTMALAQAGRWELVAEKTVRAGGSADGAIGLFEKGKSHVVAPIELKAASQFLEHAKGRSLTPIQQGWDYANKTPDSRWIIVSNYRETRLYAKSRGQAAYEVFRLEELEDEQGFLRFVALLGRDALLGGPSPEFSPLAEMLVASEHTEREVTEKLYAEYRGIRARLFDELRQKHPNISPPELLSKAQTILDRILFIAFAEDRQLLPPSTLVKAYQHKDPYDPRPIWKNFLAVFRSIDKGNSRLGISAYNGGLFRDLQGIEDLEISDETCASFKQLGEYDFSDDVSVDVLGHIFEQSISDLEQLRRDASTPPEGPAAGTQKKPSKRQVEGIFYTPPFVTSYLVRETLGRSMQEAWERAGGLRVTKKTERVAAWEAYQNELRRLRVLDPACGSGAFLVAAFDALMQEFDRSNRVLAEILRHQQHPQMSLFDLTKAVLNENLFGIDKNGESVEISRLSLWLKTAEHGKKLTFIDRNVRRGNSVVSEPLVDPWAFDWRAGHVARGFLELEPPTGESGEVIDARWREGFDVVLGNPPYVRQELLTAYKPHWSTEFRTYDGTADLFVYFFERGIQQLKPGGRLGFIVSNKWLRGGYAEKLRDVLARECTIESIVDFGHAPVFPDADAFPCIITLRKQAPPPAHGVNVTLYPREELGKELLASYVETHRFPLGQETLDKKGWTLEPPSVRELLAKLRRNGVPLADYAAMKPSYGLKTGNNEAFLVNQETKERLCREHPSSAGLLKKYLRGQDIGRWSTEWDHLWLILLKSSGDQQWPWSNSADKKAEQVFAATYPAIYARFKPLEDKLRTRSDRGRFWWELRSCAYYDAFEKPKIVYQEIQFHPQYAVDRSGFFANNKVFLLPTADTWLLAVLNSPAMWWHNWRHLVHMKDEALSPAAEKMVHVPVPRPSAAQSDNVASAVNSIVQLTTSASEATSELLGVLRVEYEVEVPGLALGDFSTMDSTAFVQEVKKRRRKGAPRLTPKGLAELRKLFETESPPVLERRAQILQMEKQIAATVHAAYKLDEADLTTLRETAPPRMPPW